MARRFLLCGLPLLCTLVPAYGFVSQSNLVLSPRGLNRNVASERGRAVGPSNFVSRVDSNPAKNFLSASAAAVNPTKASSTKTAGRKRLATLMAFLAGWANIFIFTKFKSFATMLTGNTMWMALAVTEQRYSDVAYYCSVILSYLMGTAAFRRTDLSLRKQTLPVSAVAVATLFILGDWVHYSTLSRWIPMSLFAAAFGVINSLGQEVSGTLTFVVTGHLTRLVNQFVDRWSRTAGRTKLTEAEKNSVVLNSSIFGGFFTGSAFATVMIRSGLFDRFGVFSAIGLSHAVLWLVHDMEALGGAWWLRKDGEMCDLDDDGEPCEIESTDEGVAAAESSSGATPDSLKP